MNVLRNLMSCLVTNSEWFKMIQMYYEILEFLCKQWVSRGGTVHVYIATNLALKWTEQQSRIT